MSNSSAPDTTAVPRSQCTACGAAAGGIVLVGTSPDSTGHVLLRCSRCDHVYLDGWGAEFDDELYEYFEKRIGKSREELYNATNTARQHELLDWLGARTAGRRLLDVGCGYGQLVDTASRAGWEALGLDLATNAIVIARSFGVNCREQDFFDAALDAERFDVIAMTELIEHVPSPARFLRRARDLLSPGGLLYLTTPNYASLGRRLLGGEWESFMPSHFSYFTPRVLRELAVREASLELVHAETRNFDPNVLVQLAKAAASTLTRRRRPSGLTESEPVAVPAPSSTPVADHPDSMAQQLRRLLARNAALRAVKKAVNAGLSAASAGDTMFLTFRRT